MLKVLWFSNTPALGEEFLRDNSKIKGTGGWLYALNDEMKEKINLSVAFHYPYQKQAFKYKKTNFYPIFTGNVFKKGLINRFVDKAIDDEFLNKYLEIIEMVKPDLIHIHGTENSFLCLLGKTNVPIVVSIQGNLTVYQHKYFSGFHGQYLNYKNEKSNLKNLVLGKKSFLKGYLKMREMSKIESFHLKKAQYILGRTDWDRRIMNILAPKAKYFISNEILRKSFYEQVWESPKQNPKFTVFTTNSDNYYKGFETICYSLTLLQGIGIDVEWRVAGINDNSLIKKITEKNLKSNFPKNGLKLLGSLDEEELIKNLKESHLYVMPSHIENSPNNLCEAMILGMPCISTFAGGSGTILKDKEEGILIQDGDPWVLAGAVVEMQKNFEKALEMGKKARVKALARHNKDLIVKELLNTYNGIINSINES